MKLLYIFIIVIIPRLLLGQSNYKTADVQKNNGDTLTGDINFSEWAQTSKNIEFKLNKGGKIAQSFLPNTINEFKINNYETSNAGIGIISKYHPYNDNAEKKIPIRIFAGLAISNTNTQVNNVYGFNKVNNYSSISPKISFGADFFGNPFVQRLIFRTEISFSYVTPKFKYPVVVSDAATSQVYEFNQYTTSVTPQVIYNIYNQAKFKIYFDAGLQLNVAAYSNNKLTIESSDANIVKANTINAPYKLNSFWTSFPLQAGVLFNKNTEISVTYTGYATYTTYPLFNAKNKSINLAVRFYWGKQ